MKKKAPHRSHPARAQDNGNSRRVRGQESASQKSKKSSSEKKLRVATPKDSELAFLAEAGLLITESLDVGEGDVALDLTKANNREIGRQHSMWAVFHSYAIHVLARLETQLADKERSYRIALAHFRAKHKTTFKTKWELDDAIITNKRLAKQADEIAELQRKIKLVEPV